jgi:hypothetical protein
VFGVDTGRGKWREGISASAARRFAWHYRYCFERHRATAKSTSTLRGKPTVDWETRLVGDCQPAVSSRERLSVAPGNLMSRPSSTRWQAESCGRKVGEVHPTSSSGSLSPDVPARCGEK